MVNLHYVGASEATDELYALAAGPDRRVYSYTACIVNGVRFVTINRDVGLKTQNSGISAKSVHRGEEITFYGVLLDIYEFHYIKGCRSIMFKCKWFQTEPKNRRMQQYYNITSINISSHWYQEDPFILASQAEKVFYLDDLKNGSNWKVVYKVNHRHLWDIPEKDEDAEEEVYQENDSVDLRFTCEEPDIDLIQLRRTDIDAIEVTISESIGDQGVADQDDFICDDIEEDETIAVYDSEGSINSDDSDDMEDVEEHEHIADDRDDSDNL